MRISIMLPMPPSVNCYWRMMGGRMVISDRARRFHKTVSEIVAGARVAGQVPAVPIESNVVMYIYVYPPDGRKHDVDNVLKATLDALTIAGVYKDDSQVKRIEVEMLDEIVKGGSMSVQIVERGA